MDAIIWLIVLLLVAVVGGTAAWAGLRAAPYLPTRSRDVERMLALADIKPGELVYDLGAGDGRFVLQAAKEYQAQAVGFEISVLPYLVAWLRLRLADLGDRAAMRFSDFFNEDLRPADVIVCFLTPAAMAKLGPKFKLELRPGTRIVSYAFSIPEWTPVTKEKPTPQSMNVWLYRV